MKIVKVTCDQCERDITTTHNCEGWRIRVTSESIPARGTSRGFATAVAVDPQVREDLHFCHAACLRTYFLRQWGVTP